MDSPFKYNLNDRFKLLPRSVELDDFIAAVKAAGISERTFFRDRAIKLKSKQDLPVYRLLIYSALLGCDLTDLINYKVKAQPIVPLKDRFKSPLS